MQVSEHHRIIGIRANGERDIRGSNLGKETAEAVRAAALESGQFVNVILERQPLRGEGGIAN